MKKLISIMIHHKVAANLLMIALIIPGLFALKKLNTQFLPNFKTDQILITIPWPNHSAQEIERSAVIPVEQEIKNIPDIKSIQSVV